MSEQLATCAHIDDDVLFVFDLGVFELERLKTESFYVFDALRESEDCADVVDQNFERRVCFIFK